MVKIKRKVEMTLPELIEWAWKNGVKEKAFYSNLDGGSVYFDKIQNLSIEHEIAINETFTVEVEVEEEIDEGTVLPVFAMTYINAFDKIRVTSWENTSIKSVEKNHKALAYHFLNDDGTMTLIWKDGAMVD